MITTFETHTEELTEIEQKFAQSLAEFLQESAVGKKKSISGSKIKEVYATQGLILNDIQIRKLIHFIRETGLIVGLCACHFGYFIADSKEELDEYILSLTERINAQQTILDCMKQDIKNFETVSA